MKKVFKSLFVLTSLTLLLTSCKTNKNAEGEEDVDISIADGEGYYASIKGDMSGGTNGDLRKALTSLVKPVQTVEYSAGLKTHLQKADEDPNNSANMIYFYTQDSVKKNAASSWNREHTWPQSESNSCWGKTQAGSDMLHIRPTYNSTNSSRGSLHFGEVSGSYQTYNGKPYGKVGTYFEPIDSVKGDSARIIMYIWVAWQDYYGNKMPGVTDIFQSVDVMLKWHLQDAPSTQEVKRNDYVQTTVQKNRNPFVDHPEYACKIWGNTNPTTKSLCGIK